MELLCPKCGELCEIDTEILPPRVIDDVDFECPLCDHEFVIGWYPEIEIRKDGL